MTILKFLCGSTSMFFCKRSCTIMMQDAMKCKNKNTLLILLKIRIFYTLQGSRFLHWRPRCSSSSPFFQFQLCAKMDTYLISLLGPACCSAHDILQMVPIFSALSLSCSLSMRCISELQRNCLAFILCYLFTYYMQHNKYTLATAVEQSQYCQSDLHVYV